MKSARRADPRYMQSAYPRDGGAAKRFGIQRRSDKRGGGAETAAREMKTGIAVFVESCRLQIGSSADVTATWQEPCRPAS